ncbi:hypothetical protein GOP47_0004412 [Adiantum capillus-veneris]|uniref:Uncharacterized protein n=1 Tax=Adiantum capillus-veneris TaxID=13818 RepID=A0A9D4V822_ADICA|nr:hypothetical protein GOP47_0004412 [Adiantum capillus-veneris]
MPRSVKGCLGVIVSESHDVYYVECFPYSGNFEALWIHEAQREVAPCSRLGRSPSVARGQSVIQVGAATWRQARRGAARARKLEGRPRLINNKNQEEAAGLRHQGGGRLAESRERKAATGGRHLQLQRAVNNTKRRGFCQREGCLGIVYGRKKPPTGAQEGGQQGS